MVHCCVVGCSNRTMTSPSISFHRFPGKTRKFELYKKWMAKVKREDFTPNKNTYVCSVHFTMEDYSVTTRMKEKLMPNHKFQRMLSEFAVPSLFLTGKTVASPIKKRKESKYITMKKRLETISSAMELVESQTSDHSDSYTSSTSPLCSEIEVQCEMGLEMFRSVLDVSQEIVLSTDAAVQCELGNEIYRNIIKSAESDTDDIDFEIASSAESLEENTSDDEFYEDNIRASEEIQIEKKDEEKIYFVRLKNILQMFTKCNVCNRDNMKIEKTTKGAALIIKTSCKMGHSYQWRSQDNNNKQPLLNIRLCASLYCTGMNFTTFKTFSDALGLQFISQDTYYRIIKRYVAPTIIKTWEDHKLVLWDNIKSSNNATNVWISGDGQFDSPGFCAKYVIYSVMDLRSSKVIDFEVLQKGQVSGDLEKAACHKVLSRLNNFNFNLQLFLSDRHRGIGLLLRTEFPSIRHQYDVWHLAKSMSKKLKLIEKKCPTISAWKSSIINHLWWSAQTCGGNPKMLVEKFTSVLNHICNTHEWTGNVYFHKCEHETITRDEGDDVTMWMNPMSHEFQILKSTILDKRFLKDVEHVSEYCHTGALESYHNERLKYTPKRIHFTHKGMILRSILAILDHNNNIGRPKVGETLRFSKSQKKWVYVSLYQAKNNDWRKELVDNICKVATGLLKLENIPDFGNNTIPDNIAPVPKPTLEEVKHSYFSRFNVDIGDEFETM